MILRLLCDGRMVLPARVASLPKWALSQLAEYGSAIENFWSLFDRIVHETYIEPEPQHLSRYVDEQSFRYNKRGETDLARFLQVVTQVTGKHLTYAELTTSHLKHMVTKQTRRNPP